ncbi:MAG TPA: hypothetical protein VMW19_22615 [Myxococcota bacterium]|nr:hypothetical protein [Myxococcota bacterium]
MRSRSSLLVAAALAGALLACSRGSAPPPPPAPAAAPESPPSGEAPTKAELEERLADYLGREKQNYGREAREQLDAKQRADLDIPVPPVDSLEVEKPDLMVPAPEEPAEQP